MPIHEAAIWSAFLETSYVVDTSDGEIEIRIGRATPALDALLDAQDAHAWCFITAWNPDAERLSASLNETRNDCLRRELQESGLRFLEGEGRGAGGDWPPEASLLVFGLDLAEATRLGHAHGQIAIVYGERGEAARLVDCRGRVNHGG